MVDPPVAVAQPRTPVVGSKAQRVAWASEWLPRAGRRELPEDFARRSLGYAWWGAAVPLVATVAASVLVYGMRVPPVPYVALSVLLVAGMAWGATAVPVLDVRALAATRGRRIDAHLPFAARYLATMAAGGGTLERMLNALAQQRVYGPVSEEAGLIVRDVNVFGFDFIGAVNRAAARSPSTRLQEFLQGLAATILAQGEMRSYFEVRGQQYLADHRTQQRSRVETLALMAEVFVVLAVAAPVILLILLSTISLFGGAGAANFQMGYFLILVALPLLHILFALAIRAVTPEAAE